MKSILLLSGFIFLYTLRGSSQTAYYDAAQIKALLNTSTGHIDTSAAQVSEFVAVIKNYLPADLQEENNKTIVFSLFNPGSKFYNPFLAQILYDPNIQAGFTESFTAGNAFSALGNLNVTSLADGLAKFLIKRSKEELYVYFFSKLGDSTRYPEFKILFPRTKILVDNFKSWEYANITNTLREAFDKDFKALLVNIAALNTLDTATCGKCSEDVKKRILVIKQFFASDRGRIMATAFLIGNGFIAGEKIPDVFHTIAGNDYLAGLQLAGNDFKNSIRLFDILSYSLRSNEYGHSYISKDSVRTLFKDKTLRTIYLGLLYEQFKNENLKIGNVVLTDILTPDHFNGIQLYLSGIVTEINDADTAFKQLSVARKKGDEDLSIYWGAVFESAKEFMQHTTNIQLIDSRLKFPVSLQNVFNVSGQTLEIAHDIAVRNYNAAIVGTLSFISRNSDTSDHLSDFKQYLVRYGSFAANVVQAKNSDDVEKAIESVALPVGSASVKKNTCFSVALNGYLGGFYGNEKMQASPGKKWAPITGIYAPIGITASWGLGKGGAISAFGSLLDLGAFASYRLKDDTTKALPEVVLKNIFAPGLGIIYGLPKIPLSIGYTWQYGPMLREIKQTDISVSDKPNHRWQFFIAVDIPIVNFYTKSK